MKFLLILAMCIIINNTAAADTITGVIYTPEDQNEKYWLPEEELLEVFEKDFAGFLQERLDNFAKTRNINEIPKQHEYVRQYFGTYRDGKPILMIVGHRNNKPDLEKLKKSLYFIFDGSWYLFNAYFDPQKKELISFAFNDGSS